MEFGGRTLAVMGVIAAVAFVWYAVATDPTVEQRAPEAEQRRAMRPVGETMPAPEPQKPMAEIWAESGIRASLGMRDTAFFPQMPDGDEITAAWSQSGVDRIHTMTWGDGSKVVTYWRPSETPGDGLTLHMIGQIGR